LTTQRSGVIAKANPDCDENSCGMEEFGLPCGRLNNLSTQNDGQTGAGRSF
jgi:hypothetical protein